MRSSRFHCILASLVLLFVPLAAAAEHHETKGDHELCVGFGPQTPRDIDSKVGTNPVQFALAPAYDEMNLCNIHFHKNAEHKAAAFSTFGGEGDYAGYQCGIASELSDAERAAPAGEICGGLQPGDTIEMHWVHTSCDVSPGPTLGACLSEACANPALRVETQVFTLVSEGGLDFAAFDAGEMRGGYHQAGTLEFATGEPVVFHGSTTGPSFTEAVCSPLQVTWSVRPQCAKLDIASLGAWCEDNVFDETKAHGVRKLVTNPALLAEID